MVFTWLCFCLTGDLHRDSRHAALWCFLHGLPLHNGERRWQRYCLAHSSTHCVFAHFPHLSLSTSPSLSFFSSCHVKSRSLALSLFLSFLSALPSPLRLFCQTCPLETQRKKVSCLICSHLVLDPSCPHAHPKLTWRAAVRSV